MRRFVHSPVVSGKIGAFWLCWGVDVVGALLMAYSKVDSCIIIIKVQCNNIINRNHTTERLCLVYITSKSLSSSRLLCIILAPHVADVSPTCRRHRQMSPNLGRHCLSLQHRRGPDIPNLCQLQPTSTNQPKRTGTLAT